MSRGGRGGGGGKRGPDMSWDDEVQSEPQPDTRKPQPLFPENYHIPRPKPLTSSENSHLRSLISFRERVHRGPLYTILDPTIDTSVTNDNNTTANDRRRDESSRPSKPNVRAGFDPFNDQEKYTMKYHPKKRTIPDLSQRSCYTLRLFPLELWSVLDPKRRMKEDWEGLTDEQKARIMPGRETKKRKRGQALQYEDDDIDDAEGGAPSGPKSGSEASGSDDDVVSSSRRRRQKKAGEGKPDRSSKQKKGLDAEDDFPDVDQVDEDAEGGDGAVEDQPHDSEFDTEEDDEEGIDDYNAEQYFDDGADDFGGGGDDDDDGGGGDTY